MERPLAFVFTLILTIIMERRLASAARQADPSGVEGGSDALFGEFKYQISLQRKLPDGGAEHFCGGALLSRKTVITSASCVEAYNDENVHELQVVGGDYKLYEDDKKERTRDIEVVLRHEEYNSQTHENDIALLKVKTDFFYTDKNIKSINCARLAPNAGDVCILTGWGTSEGVANVLKKVSVPVVGPVKCRLKKKKEGLKFVKASMVCAGLEGSGPCNGDLGGPLVCDGQLAGIVSWGFDCATDDFPAVFTEISKFNQWIRDNAWGAGV